MRSSGFPLLISEIVSLLSEIYIDVRRGCVAIGLTYSTKVSADLICVTRDVTCDVMGASFISGSCISGGCMWNTL